MWMAGRTPSSPRALDLFMHPASLLAMLLVGLNDHLLKQAFPGPVTGKLSDIGGMIFFPLLVAALVEIACSRTRLLGRTRLFVAIGVVVAGALLSLIKLFDPARQLAASILGAFGSIPAALVAGLAGEGQQPPWPVAIAADPSDLVALLFLVVPMYLATRPRVVLVRRQNALSPRAVILLSLAALVSLATSQPAGSLTTSATDQVSFDRSAETATRRVVFQFAPGQISGSTYAEFVIASGVTGNPPRLPVAVEVVDVASGDPVPFDTRGQTGSERNLVAAFAPIASCDAGFTCEATYSVQFRWLDFDPRPSLAFEWSIGFQALFSEGAATPPPAAVVSISIEPMP